VVENTEGGDSPSLELDQTLKLLKLQHDQTMEMFDKLIELKKLQLLTVRRESNEEV
jgi:hypothetical protein